MDDFWGSVSDGFCIVSAEPVIAGSQSSKMAAKLYKNLMLRVVDRATMIHNFFNLQDVGCKKDGDVGRKKVSSHQL